MKAFSRILIPVFFLVALSVFVNTKITNTRIDENSMIENQGAYSSTHLNGLQATEIIFLDGKTLLEDFLLTLKSFVHDTVFDVTIFLIQYRELEHKLLNIYHRSIEKDRTENSEIQEYLRFSYHILRVMKNAAERLQFYNMRNSLPERLIHKLIQLKVKLWTLCNLKGDPDPSIEGYAQIVFRSTILIKVWGDLFLELKDVPPSLGLVFELEFKKTSGLLETLFMYVP